MKPLEQKNVCTTHTLENGFTIWLNEDHSQPKVFGAVVVKAGAKDCPNTGIAHYFEHMMFKGTDQIGTINFPKEKIILDQISAQYDLLAQTEDKKSRETIQHTINQFSVEAAKYVIPNEFDRLITQYGGTKLNAGTTLDYTVFYNTFAPQYIKQWAEINSERLINPIFRLFQNELETVYEEKNMHGDYLGSISLDLLKERYFAPHPYAYPVIGSTEHLKNPQLSEMRKFFEAYYVASNMGLILSGDFQTEDVLPILEANFSRIRSGNAPHTTKVQLPPFKGKEKMKLKVPMPFVKMMAMCFRGVASNHPDEIALKVAVSLLNNSNGTGLLDRLTVDHKVTAAIAYNDCMNEAGILALLVMPKLLFQSYSTAEDLVWTQIKRIQEGDFSDETFQSMKLEQKREYTAALEDISSRAQIMMRVFSQGKKWEDFLKEIKHIDAMKKDDVMHVAQKYFTSNYLYVTKTTGKYKKEELPKPNYTPVCPPNQQAKSEFARHLEQIPIKEWAPRFVNAKELHVEERKISPVETLYIMPNAVNDIFSLDIYYGIGCLKQPLLQQLANYLHLIGTETETFSSFREKLQAIGSTLTFEATDYHFIAHVSGFDSNFVETISLVESFMRHAKAENKSLHQLINEMKVNEKAFISSFDSLAKALFEKIVYGENSRFLNKLSLKEIKNLKRNDWTDLFNELQNYGGSVHYCGNLSTDTVLELIEKHLRLSEIVQPSCYPLVREKQQYDRPVIYFLDKKDITQSIIYGYILGNPINDPNERCASRLFSNYFGGDMSSVMFQEIREFRSYAYQVSGKYKLPSMLSPQEAGYFQTYFSTQADKTVDAMEVLEGLLKNMPLQPERIAPIKQSIRNSINNTFPSFRNLSSRINAYRIEGFQEDPNRALLDYIKDMDIEDVVDFYRKQIAGRPIVYAIVGNSRRIDMERLRDHGTIVQLKVKDIYK